MQAEDESEEEEMDGEVVELVVGLVLHGAVAWLVYI